MINTYRVIMGEAVARKGIMLGMCKQDYTDADETLTTHDDGEVKIIIGQYFEKEFWEPQDIYLVSQDETLKPGDWCMFYTSPSKVLEVTNGIAKIHSYGVISESDAEFLNSMRKDGQEKLKAGERSEMVHSFSASQMPKLIASSNPQFTPMCLLNEKQLEDYLVAYKSYRRNVVAYTPVVENSMLTKESDYTKFGPKFLSPDTTPGGHLAMVTFSRYEEPVKTYTQKEVDELVIAAMVAERKRAKEIAYEFRESHLKDYAAKKIAKNEFAFISKKLAEECRYLGNIISGDNALSASLGETMEDRIRNIYYKIEYVTNDEKR